MDKDKYIESLESLLVFMCQTHEEWHEELRKLAAEEGNQAFFKMPMIQGTSNRIGISQLSKVEFKTPEYGFYEVFQEMKKKQ